MPGTGIPPWELSRLYSVGPLADVRGYASRTAELERLRKRLGVDAAAGEMAAGDTILETTAAFNVVTQGELAGGCLVLLVGTKSGRKLPRGDAARINLIIDGDALLSFIPLNAEILFSAGVITHLGTPLLGEGFNARFILYATMALERTLGHFEAATGEPLSVTRDRTRNLACAVWYVLEFHVRSSVRAA